MDRTVITVKGGIIGKESRTLREKLLELTKMGIREITLDFENVDLIDSTGIGVLVGIQNILKNNNGNLSLIKVNAEIGNMLHIMRLDKHIHIESA